MKRWMKIGLGLLGGIVVLLAALIGMILFTARPTTGPRIAAYAQPRTAVLVIDIQEDYTGEHARKRYRDGDGIVTATNAVLAQAEARGLAVVYVENVITNPVLRVLAGDLNPPGEPGTETDRRILRLAGARRVTKGRSDAFSNPELDAHLRAFQVDHVVIVGLDAAYCVNSTTHGALNRGYRVTVLRDGIATESGRSLDDLARSWRDAGATVLTSAELLAP